MCRTQIGCAVMCLGVPGDGAGKRCKWLINKSLESPSPAENPRVGGSIPPLATIQIRNLRSGLSSPMGAMFPYGFQVSGD